MDLQLQYEEILFPYSSSNSIHKINIEDEMNLYLGFSPFDSEKATSIEPNDDLSNTHEDADLKKKISFKTQILETDNKSDSNFSGETINQKKSNHHNFQKHTVTALKDIIDEAQFQNVCSNSSVLEATKKLWNQFNKIKGNSILTKKFLSILFKSDKQSVSNLKQYGFKGLFSLFPEEHIQESKEQLRKIVIELLRDKSINDHVKKRSIQRKEEFRLYLINFREQLKNSNIKKRISKESSDWINANAEIFDWVL